MNSPIPHQVRISARAKYVYLRITAQHGLQVVVPRGYNLQEIPQLLERKRKWIESTGRRLEKYRSDQLAPTIEQLPSEIDFPAIAEKWRIDYVSKEGWSLSLRTEGPGLAVIAGAIENKTACKRLLRQWLCRRATEKLSPWLRQVASEFNLPFDTVSVRLQRTRWGSCSRRRAINLNAKLLFLRPELVRYLFIHELAHLIHMNHSPRYWAFVERMEPNYRALDREMRRAMELVPRWARD